MNNGDQTSNHPELKGPPMTVTFLNHELKTSISHIIGYSEILLEDLRDAGGSDEIGRYETVFSVGNNLLHLINARLQQLDPGETPVPPQILAEICIVVRESVNKIFAVGVEQSAFADQPAFAADAKKILEATMRLERFSRTGIVSG